MTGVRDQVVTRARGMREHAFISEKVAMDVAQIWLGIIDDQFGL
ncbi:hypothetical protein [Candidatus Mycobacterium methanotrophicum]|nr:hypothetical protein [Candidatus Mycobacterium methanotrophicum]